MDRNVALSHCALILEMSLRETCTESAPEATAKIRMRQNTPSENQTAERRDGT
mgnify:CR=1 FL=1